MMNVSQRPPTPADVTDEKTIDEAAIDALVRRGPTGALVVAGIATAIVVALWFAFYLFVFLPRGAVQ